MLSSPCSASHVLFSPTPLPVRFAAAGVADRLAKRDAEPNEHCASAFRPTLLFQEASSQGSRVCWLGLQCQFGKTA